jgi:hypothetical protein
MPTSTIRLPGTDGPDIDVEQRPIGGPSVTIGGVPASRDPARKNTWVVPLTDGTTRSFSITTGWSGTVVVTDDGSRLPLGPRRPAWETVLALLPVGLVAVGGLIGGLFGGIGAAVSMTILRSGVRQPMRAGLMIGVLAVTAVAWFAVARTVALNIAPIPSYARGECMTGIGTGEVPDAGAIRSTDCATAHRGEIVGIYAIADPDGAAFPGLPAIESIASAECPGLFEDYVGIGYDASRLEMIFLHPSADTWGRGDRQIACIAIGAAGSDLNTSVAGTRQ